MSGWLLIASALAQLSPQMSDGIPGARYVPTYSAGERARAAQAALKLQAPPALGPSVTLTPDAPYGEGGARLSIWKPSFVLGTDAGGEVGINFWGLYAEGHVNLGFTPASTRPRLLDCRLLSSGGAAYKVYAGPGSAPIAEGELSLNQGHGFLVVAGGGAGVPVSVEIWPSPARATFGFLGCDLSEIR